MPWSGWLAVALGVVVALYGLVAFLFEWVLRESGEELEDD